MPVNKKWTGYRVINPVATCSEPVNNMWALYRVPKGLIYILDETLALTITLTITLA